MALRRRPPFLPSVLFLGLLAFGIEWLVVTDLEAIEQWAEEASDALNTGKLDALGALMAEDFTFDGRDREATLAFADRERRKRKAQAIEVKLHKVQVKGDRAEADVTIYATLQGMRTFLKGRVELVRGPDGWLLAIVGFQLPYGR